MSEGVDYLNGCLAGSPYLLENDERGRRRADFLIYECAQIEQRQATVRDRFALQADELRELVRQMTEARFVFESNALELTGLPLARTQEVIRAAPTGLEQLAEYIANQAITADRHLIDVLGLHRATQFAQRLASDYSGLEIPIREVDVRSLHEATVPTERFAGRYRQIEVGISGSGHVPPSVLEVPRQMAELVVWLNSTTAPPALAAAVVHSWLTIIHPFEDGNGRVARLLANVVLLRVGWPSLIVRGSDRLQYLDALSASDDGGNLLPLFDLFVKSIKRGLKDLEKPDLARRLFEADLQKDSNLRYQLWSGQLTAFLNELRAKLRPYHFDLDRLAVPEASTFLQLEEADLAGNTWLAKIRHSDGRDFLLWLGFMSSEMQDNWDVDRPSPVIFVSKRDRRPGALHPYTSTQRDGSPIDIDELALVPSGSQTPALLRYGITVIARSVADAAEELAVRLNRAS